MMLWVSQTALSIAAGVWLLEGAKRYATDPDEGKWYVMCAATLVFASWCLWLSFG